MSASGRWLRPRVEREAGSLRLRPSLGGVTIFGLAMIGTMALGVVTLATAGKGSGEYGSSSSGTGAVAGMLLLMVGVLAFLLFLFTCPGPNSYILEATPTEIRSPWWDGLRRNPLVHEGGRIPWSEVSGVSAVSSGQSRRPNMLVVSVWRNRQSRWYTTPAAGSLPTVLLPMRAQELAVELTAMAAGPHDDLTDRGP